MEFHCAAKRIAFEDYWQFVVRVQGREVLVASRGPVSVWFRVFGYGLVALHRDNPASFTERQGVVRFWRLLPSWRIGALRPFTPSLVVVSPSARDARP